MKISEKKCHDNYSVQSLTQDGILTALLIILGMIKIPSIIPGAEFQLSAPYAVCVAATIGFRRYLQIGICASLIQLMLGTHTILNVLIAMVFRIVVGILVTLFPKSKLVLCISGPIGTFVARIVLAIVLQVAVWPLCTAAIPGMVFTAVCVMIFYPVFRKIVSPGERNGQSIV